MDDFTSALYLDFVHSHGELASWSKLTMGRPLALGTPLEQRRVERDLASLCHMPSAHLGSSTLHVMWDVLARIVDSNTQVVIDQGAYEIGRWAVQGNAANAPPPRQTAHFNARAVARLVESIPLERKIVLLVDGLCPSCGRTAPLDAYQAILRQRGGLLIVDDTQRFGVRPHYQDELDPACTLTVSSLAKGFGVPVAFVAASQKRIAAIRANSLTSVHCSPVSAAHLFAARHALALNRTAGYRRRQALFARVHHFRVCLARLGIRAMGGHFPVQSVGLRDVAAARYVADKLLRSGVRAVLTKSRCLGEVAISFVLRCSHTFAQLRRAASTLSRLLSDFKHPQLEFSP